MKSLLLPILTIANLLVSATYGQSQDRFGDNAHLTDIIVQVEPGVLILPVGQDRSAVMLVDIPFDAIRKILLEYGATEVIRSFPYADLGDTLTINRHGEEVRRLERTRVFRFRFPENSDLSGIARRLESAREVLYAYPVPLYEFQGQSGLISISTSPNDTHFGSRQWNLHHTGQGHQPQITSAGRADVRAVEAWEIYKGSQNIKVGILDSGLRLSHEDLSGKVTGDGYLGISHGTHVGGIAGSKTGNARGIAGIDWHAELISRDVTGFAPETLYDKIISAVDAGASVLNNSWGSGSSFAGNDVLV